MLDQISAQYDEIRCHHQPSVESVTSLMREFEASRTETVRISRHLLPSNSKPLPWQDFKPNLDQLLVWGKALALGDAIKPVVEELRYYLSNRHFFPLYHNRDRSRTEVDELARKQFPELLDRERFEQVLAQIEQKIGGVRQKPTDLQRRHSDHSAQTTERTK